MNTLFSIPISGRILRLAMLVLTSIASIISSSNLAHGFSDHSWQLGIAYYSQNVAGKITQTIDSSPSTMGALSYPVMVKYDWSISSSWFVSPLVSYTFIGRSSAGDSTETTMLQLLLPFGQDLVHSGDFNWDWQLGPGILMYSIQGKGGVETLSNGTGSSSFARPARSVAVQTVVLDLGTSLSYSSSRFGLDIVIESPLSTGKRAESLMLSYAYRL